MPHWLIDKLQYVLHSAYLPQEVHPILLGSGRPTWQILHILKANAFLRPRSFQAWSSKWEKISSISRTKCMVIINPLHYTKRPSNFMKRDTLFPLVAFTQNGWISIFDDRSHSKKQNHKTLWVNSQDNQGKISIQQALLYSYCINFCVTHY